MWRNNIGTLSWIIGGGNTVFSPSTLLLKINRSAGQKFASCGLVLWDCLHPCCISLQQDPLLCSSKGFPLWGSFSSEGVWIKGADKTRPISLHDRNNWGVERAIASWSSSIGILRAPNGIQLDCVWNTQPFCQFLWISDIIAL